MQSAFEDCECISKMYGGNDSLILDESISMNGTAIEGRCNQGCNYLGIFLAVIFVALFLIFILQVPNVLITVR